MGRPYKMKVLCKQTFLTITVYIPHVLLSRVPGLKGEDGGKGGERRRSRRGGGGEEKEGLHLMGGRNKKKKKK